MTAYATDRDRRKWREEVLNLSETIGHAGGLDAENPYVVRMVARRDELSARIKAYDSEKGHP